MIKIGQLNTLTVVKEVDFGVFVDGGEDFGNILLPKRYVPKGTRLGDEIEVFIYFDSQDEIIATTEKPLAHVGQFAKLNCISTTPVGAFLNWGLPKDLLVPFSEQRIPLQEGRSYLVFLYMDNASGRIVGTTKFNKFLDKTPARYEKGEQVHVTIVEETDLGYKCAINDAHSGLLFKSEVFGKLFVGKSLRAYVKQMREDGKIDLSLQKLGRGKLDDLSEKVLHTLELKGGFLPVNDKSSPDEIFELFRTSKATFKKTIGSLYKERRIRIEQDGIHLTK
ncbi:GntR family transcriptional regulator [Enterovibrio norvegicus FF-33]|uniref:GntR family transcriptional regulator n=1 Tax=Enterovibrio norvegicus FF-454 TaxID=1185651 RepID=A0A1E5CAL0_9GAMM|nr:S1-like domain-containing RNA-binding protein [Enterovibrio norvegicus]OEE62222.1 GntR family transcriptional regulator [Enterovibrio norvegicus FF-454]OEE65807.1 GntR family transcriptional regulator [Enterovibrio norvegicus FF-33]OEE89161.1 GntR family transcriptional regulator [Enterovibrio norvegicus FF-162]